VDDRALLLVIISEKLLEKFIFHNSQKSSKYSKFNLFFYAFDGQQNTNSFLLEYSNRDRVINSVCDGVRQSKLQLPQETESFYVIKNTAHVITMT